MRQPLEEVEKLLLFDLHTFEPLGLQHPLSMEQIKGVGKHFDGVILSHIVSFELLNDN